MRRRKPTSAELQARVEYLEKAQFLAQFGLTRSLTERPDCVARITWDGFRYTFRAYRLTSASGGIVVVQAHCTHNQQTDTVVVHYLDELRDQFPLSAFGVQSAIATLRMRRQELAVAEIVA